MFSPSTLQMGRGGGATESALGVIASRVVRLRHCYAAADSEEPNAGLRQVDFTKTSFHRSLWKTGGKSIATRLQSADP